MRELIIGSVKSAEKEKTNLTANVIKDLVLEIIITMGLIILV